MIPRFRPVAVNGASVAVEKMNPAELLAGSASRTDGGIVNVPALAGAVQTATAPLVLVLSVGLYTSIRTFPLPPVQVAVMPLERVTVALFTGLVRVGDAGMVNVALNGPTSAPPVPVTV
jgi:hypothetical protein